jgi:hypothetical protein
MLNGHASIRRLKQTDMLPEEYAEQFRRSLLIAAENSTRKQNEAAPPVTLNFRCGEDREKSTS